MLISRVRKEVSHSDWLFVGKLKGETIRKLMGGEVQKKYSRKGKLNEKNSCNPKKYLCYGLKAIHSRTLIRKKNSCGSKIFYITIVFDWDDCDTQEKLETMVIQNLGGKQGAFIWSIFLQFYNFLWR